MKNKFDYSFLKDELALNEIRKHKWIESEKIGKEIGFATAAVDWIKKHGADFQRYRLGQKSKNIFSERRNLRRFSCHWPVYLKIHNQPLTSYTDNINLQGLTCTVPFLLQENAPVEATLHFPWRASPTANASLVFQSRIKRITHLKPMITNPCLQIFLPFSEEVKHYLQEHTELFSH